MILKFNYVNCWAVVVNEKYQIIYYFSWVNRFVLFRFVCLGYVSEKPADKKIDMIPRVKIISRKAAVVTVNGTGGSARMGATSHSGGDLGVRAP